MTPVDQTTFGHPGGNCFSACVASLLELPISEVPYFMDESGDNLPWVKQLNDWLAPRGYYSMHFVVNETNREAYDRENLWPAGFYILCGKSPRGDHAVVARGKDVVHDPHPGRDFILSSVDAFTLLVPTFDGARAKEADRG
jgi:hypothetical protein